jgi:hypothetical protein
VILLLLGFFAALAAWQWIPLYKQGHKRDLWLNIVLMLLSLTVHIFILQGIRVTTPIWDYILKVLRQLS